LPIMRGAEHTRNGKCKENASFLKSCKIQGNPPASSTIQQPLQTHDACTY